MTTLDLKALRERLTSRGRDGFDYATISALLDELVALRAALEAVTADRDLIARDVAFHAECRPNRRQAEQMRAALETLIIDANRLCDRQLGGTYEDDCRRSIAAARAALTPHSDRSEP